MTKTPKKRATTKGSALRKVAGARVMTAAAAIAHATANGKAYFKSLPVGTWIACDWDPAQQKYDNCIEVPASEVPKSWGGDGP